LKKGQQTFLSQAHLPDKILSHRNYYCFNFDPKYLSMNLLYIVWDVSPEIFSLGPLTVRWYGLLFAMSFVLGYPIMQKFFTKEGKSQKLLDELSTYMLIATVVGARLGHCLFYEPAQYLANPIDILKVWEGGLASHGAAVGILLAIYFFSRKNKIPYLWVMDRVVVVVALAAFFIRTGNLMNSEIFGTVTDLPWGFVFQNTWNPAEAVDPRHPTQLYEGLFYLLTFGFLLWYYYKKDGKPQPGFLFGVFLICIFGSRFFIEFIKLDQVGFESTMALNMGQWLSIPLVFLGLWLLIRSLVKPKKNLASK
jgi:phosphatidylglycerol---prolipoprotein diacylglyceryl transferase